MNAGPATTDVAASAVGTPEGVNQEKGQNQMTRENTVNVPVDPTDEMLDAFWRGEGESREMRPRMHERGRRVWRSFLSAAPLHEGEGEPVAWRFHDGAPKGKVDVTAEADFPPPPPASVSPGTSVASEPNPSVEVERLREALEECVSVMAMQEHPAFPDPAYHAEVKALGERIGFGALMSTASAGWRETLSEKGYPTGGHFVAGPCFGTLTVTLAQARAALSRKQEPGVPTPGAWIEWSGGANPVPGRNAEVKLRSGDCFTGSDLSPDATWQHIWGEADIIAYRIVPTPGGEGK